MECLCMQDYPASEYHAKKDIRQETTQFIARFKVLTQSMNRPVALKVSSTIRHYHDPIKLSILLHEIYYTASLTVAQFHCKTALHNLVHIKTAQSHLSLRLTINPARLF
ncbi:uncharacterized protein EAE97_005784 [Botrytis byssoidea]|uniref:Uncharacterized protein n=1 Tax=Botrytis byssoidea TaxID=139641 RepID=A0A9P5IQW5_9HELO|nr:uncharacterized protein EAE97_005784 [Botrytis byssoidea]KAF7943714.1 hypothetical protein EAE97_005784 [Botrytis byssoidea]